MYFLLNTSISSHYICWLNEKSAKTPPALLQPVTLPEGPWPKVVLDTVSPFYTAAPDCKYALTLTDSSTDSMHQLYLIEVYPCIM